MVPVSIALSDLFKVTIIQRQINVNSTSRQRQLPITGVLALPRPLCETARDVRVVRISPVYWTHGRISPQPMVDYIVFV